MRNIDNELSKAQGQLEGFSLSREVIRTSKMHVKRLWIALIVVLVLWGATVGGFLWFLSAYECVSTEYRYIQDGDGENTIITGNSEEVYYKSGPDIE